jgi:hypothetical protein
MSDTLYCVNGGTSKSLAIQVLRDTLTANGMVSAVNGKTGNVSLSKADIGLSNVPNAIPVNSLNGLNAAVTLANGSGIQIDILGQTITISVANLQIPWGSINGDITDQTDLISLLATVGVQQNPRTVTDSANFNIGDLSRLWVNVDSPTDAVMTIPLSLGAVIGSMLEVRQCGIGGISIATAAGVTLFSPYGITTTTSHLGQRIQLICLGPDSWEYR